jgi:methylthioribose-1-phosphate isomerase
MPSLSECTHEVRVVYFEDGKLFLVDQKVLPLTFTVLTVTTLEQTWEAIKDMTVRGAPAIGAAGAFGLVLAARASSATSAGALHKELLAAKAYLDSSRPTAVNLAWATGRILDIVEAYVAASPTLSAAALAAAVEAEAQALAEEDVAVNRALAKHGAEVVPQNANILHHCNTGALATVDIGTALGVIYECHAQKKNVHVWVDETRPRLQGARLTAWELQRAGVPLHLIVDSAAGMLMAQKRVDCFLFGADRVAANGDVANKVGTFKNCVVAWELGVATYACVPTSTVDLTMATGGEIHIEERSAEEVTVIDGVRVAPEGVPVYNPAFDVTPAKYITGIITEEGVCYRPFEVSLRKAKKAAEDRARIAWKAKLNLLLGGDASS